MATFLEANHSRSITTYSAGSGSVLVSTAGATDIWALQGSSSKIVRLQTLNVSGESSTNVIVDTLLIKRSSPDTGGVFTTPAIVPHDSTNPPATAVVRAYTTNPTLGSTVGIVRGEHIMFAGAAAPNLAINPLVFDFSLYDGQTPCLRGSSESFCINLSGAVMGAGNVTVDAQWTEE